MELNIFHEYDQVLLGKRDSDLSSYMINKDQNIKLALKIIKYALTYYLNWSPNDIYHNLNYEIIKDMKLEKMLEYIKFPIELDKKKDLFYIAILLYPRYFNITRLELTINYYKEILEGKKVKFPKEYFSGQMGCVRAQACFQYIITHHLSFNTIDEMYEHFSSSEGIKTLKKYKLGSLCTELFDSPLDFLHLSLPENERNYYIYNHKKFIVSQRHYKKLKTREVINHD